MNKTILHQHNIQPFRIRIIVHKEELIWNSTANLTGKEGGNLGLDLVNEFLNNGFKSKYFKNAKY
jgi:hypothetical protein